MTTTTQPTLVELAMQLERLGQIARSILESPDLELHQRRRTSLNYETELIQVAASAIAALEDLRLQQNCSKNLVYEQIEREIYQERLRQNEKFGAMPRRLDPLVWIAVMAEELAEVSEGVWG